MTTDPSPSGVTIALGNSLEFSVDGGPSAPGAARTELGERFGAKLDPEVVGLAQLLLSELVTNCVLHGAAGRPGVWVSVRASIFPDTLRVEVSDGGAAFRHEAGLPAPDLDAGRGLWLVAMMSRHWGLTDSGPARVWFEISRTQGGEEPRRGPSR